MTNTEHTKTELLGPEGLKGIRIAISASESPDLLRLGLVETHFKLAVGEIARCVLISGGKLAYGGHLDPEGYTAFLVQELQRYSRRDRPLRVCLAWQEHRKLSYDEFEGRKSDLGLLGEIVCLGPEGDVVDFNANRGMAPELVHSEELLKKSLTGLRRYMARNTNGRVLIGGRRTGFQGILPGLLEEAMFSLENEQPLYLAGGFGGVTTEIIAALGINDGTWLPTRAGEGPADNRLTAGLKQLSQIAKSKDWRGLNNGLTDEENRRLATTYRPTEIAALVSLGVGRRFAA